MKRLVYLIILSTCLLESKAQKVSIELLKSAKWELTSPDYSSYRHTTFQFTDSQLKETIYYKKDKKTLSACNSYYLADTKTEYFDDQQVGKKSRGRYIIQKRYDGKAVCKEVVSASANHTLNHLTSTFRSENFVIDPWVALTFVSQRAWHRLMGRSSPFASLYSTSAKLRPLTFTHAGSIFLMASIMSQRAWHRVM